MDRPYIVENNRERDRLRNLVNSLTDWELNQIIYKEGWTVAVALAHLAFWDQRRLVLISKWRQKGVAPSTMDGDTINDALIPFFLAITPRKAAEMAISVAEELDKELEKLSPDLIAAINAQGDVHALNRAVHRKTHLDEIEAFLRESRQ